MSVQITYNSYRVKIMSAFFSFISRILELKIYFLIIKNYLPKLDKIINPSCCFSIFGR